MENKVFQTPNIIDNPYISPTFEYLNVIESFNENDVINKWVPSGLLDDLEYTNKVELAKLLEYGAHYLIFREKMRVVEIIVSDEISQIDIYLFSIIRRLYSAIYSKPDVYPYTDYEIINLEAASNLKKCKHMINISKLVQMIDDAFSSFDKIKVNDYLHAGVDIEAETCIMVCDRYILDIFHDGK
jgi:hypothetical protein